MAKRRRRRKQVKLKIRSETVQSIVALFLIAVGLLIVVSFSGQGQLLTRINAYLSMRLGASLLLLPFVFLSAGIVLFSTKWAWSKPHVFLGTLLIFLGTIGFFQTGTIGADTYRNVSILVAPAGAYILFLVLLISGLLIMTQFSIAEVVELTLGIGSKKILLIKTPKK